MGEKKGKKKQNKEWDLQPAIEKADFYDDEMLGDIQVKEKTWQFRMLLL